MKKNNSAHLFRRLAELRMLPRDVKKCLAMDQSDYLSMLFEGVKRNRAGELTRKSLADMLNVPHKTIYSWFATEGAADYRTLSDDARIALLWRITNLPAPKRKLRERLFIVNGVEMNLKSAAAALGYVYMDSLSSRIKRSGIIEHSDISHLKNERPGGKVTRFYMVNGERLSTYHAAKLLGFKGNTQLAKQIKELNLPEESDISHLKPVYAVIRHYIVNGERVSTSQAAKLLGFSSANQLYVLLEKLNLPPESDISHVKKERPARKTTRHYIVDGERVTLNQAAKLLGFSSGSYLLKKLKNLNLLPESDISHVEKEQLTSHYIVNSERVSANQAAKLLGFSSGSNLYKKLEKLNLPPESDISHVVNERPVRHYIVNGERVSTNQAAKLLGFSGGAYLSKKLNTLSLPPESDISHIKPARYHKK